MNTITSFTQKISQNHEESYTYSKGDSVLRKGLKYAAGTGLAAAALSESAVSGVLSMITFPFKTTTSLKNRASASLNTAQTIMGQKLGATPKKAAIAALALTAAGATAYFFGPSLLASKTADLLKTTPPPSFETASVNEPFLLDEEPKCDPLGRQLAFVTEHKRETGIDLLLEGKLSR